MFRNSFFIKQISLYNYVKNKSFTKSDKKYNYLLPMKIVQYIIKLITIYKKYYYFTSVDLMLTVLKLC
jgi:hypothetical protein